MIEAHTLESILNNISGQLPFNRVVKTTTLNIPPFKTGFMVTDTPKEQFTTTEHTITVNSKLIGILFCRPDSEMIGKEILTNLPYFHFRSGEYIDFYCVGYGAYWPSEKYPDQRLACRIDDADWFFSDENFVGSLEKIEKETKWKYSGEPELILVNTRKKNNGKVEICYDAAIVCRLEKMLNDKAFTSVRSFFECIFRSAKNNLPSTSTLSNQEGLNITQDALKELVLSILPTQLKETYKRAEHFVIRDIEKSN